MGTVFVPPKRNYALNQLFATSGWLDAVIYNAVSAFRGAEFKEFVNRNFIWSKHTVGIFTISFLWLLNTTQIFNFVEGNSPVAPTVGHLFIFQESTEVPEGWLWDLKPFTLGPVFQSHINNDWKLFISAGSLVASMKSLSGPNLTPEGTVMIDSLNKEDKSGKDLLTRSEWISPVGMTVFISYNLALSDLRV